MVLKKKRGGKSYSHDFATPLNEKNLQKVYLDCVHTYLCHILQFLNEKLQFRWKRCIRSSSTRGEEKIQYIFHLQFKSTYRRLLFPESFTEYLGLSNPIPWYFPYSSEIPMIRAHSVLSLCL